VRAARRVGLEGERVAVRRGEGVTVGERVGRGGLVAQGVDVQVVGSAAAGRVHAARRDEAPGIDAGPDGGRPGPGDDADLQAGGFGAPEGGVRVEGHGRGRRVVGVLCVLAQGQVQSWREQRERKH